MWQFSNRFHFFFFEVVVIDAWSRYFVELPSRLVCQLTISLHTFLCMISHIISPWRNTKILEYGSFSVPPVEIRDSNMVLQLSTIFLLISHCLWVHSRNTWSRNDVGSPKSTSLFSTFHIGSMFCFFPANFMSSTCTDKNKPFFMKKFPIGNLFPTALQ